MVGGGLVGTHGVLEVSEWEMGEECPSFPTTPCRGSGLKVSGGTGVGLGDPPSP